MTSGENHLADAEFQHGMNVSSKGDPSRIYRVQTHTVRSGGMANIYKALDTRLQRVVAIKTDQLSSTEQNYTVDRESLVHLQSKNHFLVRLYDLVEIFGGTGIVMEYFDPKRTKLLFEYGRGDKEPLPKEDFLLIIRQLAQFIDSYAAEGKFHRDLKLKNVFFFPEVYDRYIKVIDLGLGGDVDADSASRAKNYVVGTPGYLSPQRWNAEKTKLTDEVYAIGVIAYLILMQQQNINDTSDRNVQIQFARDEKNFTEAMKQSKVLASWGSDPTLVAAVLERALHPDESERYQNGAAFFAELEQSVRTPREAPQQNQRLPFWKKLKWGRG